MALIRNSSLSALAAALLLAGTAWAQDVPATGQATYTIFMKGQQIGREEGNLVRTPDGWRVSSTSRMAAGNLSLENRHFEVRYSADWQPVELRIDALVNGRKFALNTSFGLTTAVSEITSGEATTQKTDTISARALVVPNNFYAGYEAVAARLVNAEKGAEFPAYVAPQMEVALTVEDVSAEQIQTTSGTLAVRRFRLKFQNPGLPVVADIWVDGRGRMARLEVPSVTLQVVREELATAMTRFEVVAHPGDEAATIPAHGFTLAATVTRPVGQQQKLRFPAVILVAGSGPHDRNETVFGIPIFGQIANALADAGFLVVRYDKRGVGQSGGRAESATLNDFAEDVRAVFRYTTRRPDVDKRRIALLGHSEGAAVAMITATREKNIAGLILVAGMGSTGAEVVLEQQQHVLARSKFSEEERRQKIELQQQIHRAVATGKGWEEIPPDIRGAAQTPWFQSFLTFDPAKVMKDMRQPILVLQGALDTQVAPHHAEKLAALARARKKGGPVEVKVIEGVNHLLVPAQTGEFDEYPDLKEKKVSAQVIEAIREWLGKSL
ncbi:MAG TPA: alpha/beta fold hydrolase, partial [Vicinamibacterales bacterium]|nr:alpha/beta fold hydrolase [Vicinamibacterales bacterium]